MAEATYPVGSYRVAVPDGFGPRLLGFRPRNGPELLVRLGPEVGLDSGAGRVRLRGGHRLWVAPEVPELTHLPDDTPCGVTFAAGRLAIHGPVDGAGFTKEVAASVTTHEAVVVDHRLTWSGPGSVTVAAWAITQVPLGGVAVLPIGGRPGGSFQADRSLVLWPYTDLSDPRLRFGAGTALVTAAPGPQLKVGSGPRPGRLGYLRDGWLFTKTVAPADDGAYADRQAVAQVFVNDAFCELESLGPLVRLEPGESVEHREVWEAQECPDLDTAVEWTGEGRG